MTLLTWTALFAVACGSRTAPEPAPCPESRAPAATGPVGPQDPQALLRLFAQTPDLPLLTEEAKTEILDSAVWSSTGLAGFHAARAREELSEDEMLDLLQVMGIPHDGVIKDAYCAGRATCRSEPGAYCVIANCRRSVW